MYLVVNSKTTPIEHLHHIFIVLLSSPAMEVDVHTEIIMYNYTSEKVFYKILLTRAHRWRVIVVYMCVYVCVCLSVRLDLRDCLIWRQYEHSDGKVSSSSAKDICGFL